jgi:hypothetical protein
LLGKNIKEDCKRVNLKFCIILTSPPTPLRRRREL